MINERQLKFINALKTFPEYDGWNDDEIKENVNEVMNSNDGNRKLNFVRALSILPEYENFNDYEIQDNVKEVFELNQPVQKVIKNNDIKKYAAVGQLKKAYKDLLYEFEEFNINPSNIKKSLSQIESNLRIAGDIDITDESGENIRPEIEKLKNIASQYRQISADNFWSDTKEVNFLKQQLAETKKEKVLSKRQKSIDSIKENQKDIIFNMRTQLDKVYEFPEGTMIEVTNKDGKKESVQREKLIEELNNSIEVIENKYPEILTAMEKENEALKNKAANISKEEIVDLYKILNAGNLKKLAEKSVKNPNTLTESEQENLKRLRDTQDLFNMLTPQDFVKAGYDEAGILDKFAEYKSAEKIINTGLNITSAVAGWSNPIGWAALTIKVARDIENINEIKAAFDRYSKMESKDDVYEKQNKILKSPEYQKKLTDIQEKYRKIYNDDIFSKTPQGIEKLKADQLRDISQLNSFFGITNKSGEELKKSDEELINSYIDKEIEKKVRDKSIAYGTLDILENMPELVTGIKYGANVLKKFGSKKLEEKIAARLLKMSIAPGISEAGKITEQISGELAKQGFLKRLGIRTVSNLPTALGTTVTSLPFETTMIMKNTFERDFAQGLNINFDKSGKIIPSLKIDNKEHLNNLIKSTIDMAIENFSEMTGEMMTSPKMWNKLADKLVKKYGKETGFTQLLRSFEADVFINRLLKQNNIQNIPSEYLEERIGDLLRIPAGLADKDKTGLQNVYNALFPDWKQFWTEAIGFSAVPAGAMVLSYKSVKKDMARMNDLLKNVKLESNIKKLDLFEKLMSREPNEDTKNTVITAIKNRKNEILNERRGTEPVEPISDIAEEGIEDNSELQKMYDDTLSALEGTQKGSEIETVLLKHKSDLESKLGIEPVETAEPAVSSEYSELSDDELINKMNELQATVENTDQTKLSQDEKNALIENITGLNNELQKRLEADGMSKEELLKMATGPRTDLETDVMAEEVIPTETETEEAPPAEAAFESLESETTENIPETEIGVKTLKKEDLPTEYLPAIETGDIGIDEKTGDIYYNTPKGQKIISDAINKKLLISGMPNERTKNLKTKISENKKRLTQIQNKLKENEIVINFYKKRNESIPQDVIDENNKLISEIQSIVSDFLKLQQESETHELQTENPVIEDNLSETNISQKQSNVKFPENNNDITETPQRTQPEDKNTKIEIPAAETTTKLIRKNKGREERDLKLKEEGDALAKELIRLTMGKLSTGVDPELLVVSTKLVNNYIKRGFYKIKDIIIDLIENFGKEQAKKIFNSVKQGYLSAQATADENDYNKMNDTAEVRKLNFDEVFNEEFEEKKQQPLDKTEKKEYIDNKEKSTEAKDEIQQGKSADTKTTGRRNDVQGQRGDRRSVDMDAGQSTGRSAGTVENRQGSSEGKIYGTGETGGQSVLDELQNIQPESGPGGTVAGEGVSSGDNARGSASVSVSGRRGRRTGRKRGDNRKDTGTDEKTDLGMAGRDTARTGRSVNIPSSSKISGNYRIKEKELDFEGAGAETKIKNNIDAIKLLKQIQSENREATENEKSILVKYVGWGAFSEKIFNNTFDSFARNDIPSYVSADAKKDYEIWKNKYGQYLHPNLGGLLTEKEWREAAASTLNAHYTSEEVIRFMWKIAEKLGFTGGNVLEPATGAGHFFGLMPENLIDNTSLFGVELDPTTAGIAKLLYPQANIQNTGFEKVNNIPANSIDLVISNFPFGNFQLSDNGKNPYSDWNIHNYFFGKTIDLVSPDGLILAITSRFTLDSMDMKVREYLKNKVDFVGAIRLPNNAFQKNAGTQVVTDIIILKKKGNINIDNDTSFLNLGQIEINEKDYWINNYFIKNPEMIIGNNSSEGSMYGGNEYTVVLPKNISISEELNRTIEKLPENIFAEANIKIDTDAMVISQLQNIKNGQLINQNGKLFINNDGKAEPVKNLKENDRIKLISYIELKDTLKKLIQTELDENATEGMIEDLRKKLNTQYDLFVNKYKSLNENINKKIITANDVEYTLISSIEGTKITEDKDGKEKREYFKMPIFSKRINQPFISPKTAQTLDDAINISIIFNGGIDIQKIADLLDESDVNKIYEKIVKEKYAFENPETGLLELPEDYLSGRVVEKLNIAKEKAKDNPKYEINVTELEKVQPKRVPIEKIDYKIGSTWLHTDIISFFIKNLLDFYSKPIIKQIKTGEQIIFKIENRAQLNRESNAKNTEVYGMDRASAVDIIEDMLNLRKTLIYDTIRDENGNNKSVKNVAKTLEAEQRANKIESEFKKVLKANEKIMKWIEDEYNNLFNQITLKKSRNIDISHFPGANKKINLYQHQKNAILRGLKESYIMAFGVGKGKTFTLITTAMEMKRIGTAKKPMLVVLNSTIEQIVTSFKLLYPNANILYPPTDKETFSKEERKLFLSRAATNNYDCIITPHSFFDRLANVPELEEAYVSNKIREIRMYIEDVKKSGAGGRNTVKELEKIVKNLTTRLEKLTNAKYQKENIIYFQDLGIDAILIDEAHRYKRGFFYTKTNVKGIDKSPAQRSIQLSLRIKDIQEKTNGKNIVLATGTPISNTMAELWTMVGYVRPDLLKEFGIEYFDNFLSTFCSVKLGMEQKPSGNFAMVERLRRFTNGQSLLNMWRTAADVVFPTVEEEEKHRQETGRGKPLLKNNAVTPVIINKNADMAKFIEYIQLVQAFYDNLSGGQKKEYNFIPITLYGYVKAGTIDLRLVDGSLGDNGKIEKVVETAVRVYKEQNKEKGTQLLFCDRMNQGNYNLYTEIKNQLVKQGIPESEIVIVNNLKKREKEIVFNKINSGKIRIALGSTEKLGTGVNVQNKLYAIHHIDIPARPSDFEQRNGRILREGNQYKEVEIFYYGINDTLDSTLFTTLQYKHQFIMQILRGEIQDDSFDDPAGEIEVPFDDMVAILSGNPLYGEKFTIEKKIQTLKMTRRSFNESKANAADSIRDIKQQIPKYKKWQEFYVRFISEIKSKFPENQILNIDGKTKKEDINKYINDLVEKYKKELTNDAKTFKPRYQQIFEKKEVSINGIKILLTFTAQENPSTGTINFNVDYSYKFEDENILPLSAVNVSTGQGLLTSIKNNNLKIFDMPQFYKNKITQAEKNINDLESIVESKFEQENEITELENRLDEIENILRKTEGQNKKKEINLNDPELRRILNLFRLNPSDIRNLVASGDAEADESESDEDSIENEIDEIADNINDNFDMNKNIDGGFIRNPILIVKDIFEDLLKLGKLCVQQGLKTFKNLSDKFKTLFDKNYEFIKNEIPRIWKELLNESEVIIYNKSDFGTIYTQFKDKPREAIEHLLKVKEGDAKEVIYKEGIGWIDFVYGKEGIGEEDKGGYGLAHIIKRHGINMAMIIPDVIEKGKLNLKHKKFSKIYIEDKNIKIVIKLEWNNKKKIWLVSTFIIKPHSINRTPDVVDTKGKVTVIPTLQSEAINNITNLTQFVKSEEEKNITDKLNDAIDEVIDAIVEPVINENRVNNGLIRIVGNLFIQGYQKADIIIRKINDFIPKRYREKIQKFYKYIVDAIKIFTQNINIGLSIKTTDDYLNELKQNDKINELQKIQLNNLIIEELKKKFNKLNDLVDGKITKESFNESVKKIDSNIQIKISYINSDNQEISPNTKTNILQSPKTKISKFYNTFERTGLLETLGYTEEQFSYLPTSRQLEINEAITNLQNDFWGEYERLLIQEQDFSGSDNITMAMMVKIFADNNDYDKSKRLVSKIREELTTAGQFIEATKFWKNMSANILRIADKIYVEAQKNIKTQTNLVNKQTDEIQEEILKINQEQIESLKNEIDKLTEQLTVTQEELDRIKIEYESEKENKKKIKIIRVAQKTIDYWDEKEQAARKRIEQRKKGERLTLNAGLASDELQDYAIIGASKIVKFGVKFSIWAAEMTKDFGNEIKPFLKQIYDKSKETLSSESQEKEKTTIAEKLKNLEPSDILARRIIKAASVKNKINPTQKMLSTLYKLAKEHFEEIKNVNDLKEFIEIAIQNKDKYSDIYFQAKKAILNEFDNNAELQVQIEENLKEYFEFEPNKFFPDKMLESVVKKEIKKLNVDLNKIVKQHYTKINIFKKTLSEKLLANTILNENESQEFEVYISDKMNELTKQKKEQILKKMFGIFSASEKNKTAIEKIIELSNLGAFDKQDIFEILAKRINLPHLDNETAKILKNWADKIQVMPDGLDKIREQQKLLKFIKDRIPSTLHTKITMFQTLSQLLNAKTTIRNFGGNSVYASLDTLTRNFLALPIDSLLSLKSGKREISFGTNDYLNSFVEGWKKGIYDNKYGINTIRSEISQMILDNAKMEYENRKKDAEQKGEDFNEIFNDFQVLKDFQELLKEITGSSEGEVLGQYDIKSSVFNDKFFGSLEKTLGYLLTVPDRAFFTATFESSLKNQLIATKKQYADKNIITQALLEALTATFQDINIFSKFFINLQKVLNLIDPVLCVTLGKKRFVGAGDIILKYPKTPGNLLARAVDYSPLGFLKTFTYFINSKYFDKRYSQRQLSLDIARGISGTAMWTLGLYLLYLGIASGGDDDNDKLNDLKTAIGERKYSINTTALFRFLFSGLKKEAAKTRDTDTWVSYDWVQPLSISFAMGVETAKRNKDISNDDVDSVTKWFNFTIDSVAAGINTLSEQPLISNLTRTVAYNKGIGDILTNIAKDMPASFIPTLTSQIRYSLDPNLRNMKDENKFFWSEIFNKIQNKLPGFSKNLPPRVNVLGKEISIKDNQFGTILNILGIFINPAIITEYHQDKGIEFILQVYENTGESEYLPKNYSQKKEIMNPYAKKDDKNKKIKLSFEECNKLQKIYAEKYLKAVNQSENLDLKKLLKIIKNISDDTAKEYFGMYKK